MALPNCLRSLTYLRGAVPRALRQPKHLRADADASLVQRLDGNLVALARLAEHVGGGDPQSSKMSSQVMEARMPSLSSFLPTEKPGKSLLHEERGDALVAGTAIDGGEDEEEPGLLGVGDPQLPSVQDVVVARASRRASASANASEPEPASLSA